MAGIRVDTPVGPGWLYSLDTETWQPSNVFNSLPTGAAFVLKTVYTIYCKNPDAGLIAIQSIRFGDASSEDTLQTLAARTDLRTSQYESPGGLVTADQLDGQRLVAFMSWARMAGYIAVEMPLEYVKILISKIIQVLATSPDLASALCALLPCQGDGSGSTGNNTGADEVELAFLGCYQGPIVSEGAIWLDVSGKTDGDQIPNPLAILRPICTFFRYIPDDDNYQLDLTVGCKRAESAEYIKINIPGGGTWTGKIKLEKPTA